MLKKIKDIKIQNYDHVVVGTGPAGITLALQLKKKNKNRVLLVEAGSFEYEEDSQEFYKGEIINNCNLKELHESRIRAFGGTSMVWGGMCRELDEIDFDEWPIKKTDLSIYLEEAKNILLVNENFLDDKFIDENIKLIDFQWSEPTIRFNDFYKDKIINDKKIDLLINTAVTKIEGNTEVEMLELFDHKENNFYKVKPKNIILACGAIENSRILLYSQTQSKNSFLKPLAIGKNYLVHPHYVVAKSLVEMEEIKKAFDQKYMTKEMFFVSPSNNFIKENAIGNIGLRFQVNEYPHDSKELLKDLLCIAPDYAKKIAALGNKKIDCTNIKFFSSWEVKPNNENYINLDESNIDKLGIPRVKVNVNLNENTKKTVKIFVEEVGKFLIDKELGRVAIRNFFYSDKYIWPKDGYGGSHEMGGTKMGVSTKDSVVDKNLKVHGIENLYILGSSVFPTCGHANPTLTICQLALRLGNYLNKLI